MQSLFFKISLAKEQSIYMSQKGPEVGQGILDFVEDCRIGVKSH